MSIVTSLTGGLVQIPVLVVALVGIVIAVVRWSRDPRASLLAVLGLVVLIGQTLLGSLAVPWLQVTLIRRDFRPQRLGLMLTLLGLVIACIRAAGLGLMIAAAFVGRGQGDHPPGPVA